MSHIHKVIDTDTHYKIDGITRTVTNIDETKRMLVQNDHNSERFTFEIPRFVDGHDFLECNVVQVHYINVDAAAENKSEGIYTVNDLHVKGESEEDKNIVVLSWLIDGNATKYVGTLNFAIRFSCVTGKTVDYAWHTTPFEGILIKDGINNSEIVIKPYEDILAIWEGRIKNAEQQIEQQADYTSQGKSAKYSFTKYGWKRVLNIIRTSGGTVNFGLTQSDPNYMCQALGINFSGFVKYGKDTSIDKKPVLYQLYNNIFGEDNAVKNSNAKIKAVRIGYPKQGTKFPNSDGAVEDYGVNPVNCYLDIYVEFYQLNSNRGYCGFNMNYAGFSDSHNCVPITEETDATNVGIYGEELEFSYLNLSEDASLYMPNDAIKATDIEAENLRTNGEEVWSGKEVADKVCPEFCITDRANLITCNPVEKYPLSVCTYLNGSRRTGTSVVHTGKNLLPMMAEKEKSKGVIFEPVIYSDAGYVLVYGKAESKTFVVYNDVKLPPGTYTFSIGYTGNPNCYAQVYRQYSGGPMESVRSQIGVNVDRVTFTLDEFATIRVRLFVQPNVDISQRMYPQLELGNTASKYEIYCGQRHVVDFHGEYENCGEFDWNKARLEYGELSYDDDGEGSYEVEVFEENHVFRAFNGVNILYTENEDDEMTYVFGRSDLNAHIKKLTNAIISLGGNIT